jgi:hypothetical protein
VIDEAFGIARLPGGVPQVLLQRRERTVEADGHDDQRVDDGRHVQPQQPGPAPRQKTTDGDERDEAEVDDHDEVCQESVEHDALHPARYLRLLSSWRESSERPRGAAPSLD